MKRKMLCVFLLSLLPLAAATPARADADGDAAAVLAVLERLGGIIEENAGSCAAMGAAAMRFVDANGARYAELNRRLAKLPDAEKKRLEGKYRDRTRAVIRKLVAAGKCASDAKLEAAMDKLDSLSEEW